MPEGSGKMALLEKTLSALVKHQVRAAALVGDLAAENDAARLARSQAPVRQIITETVCHLEAEMVRNALDEWQQDNLDFLLIENVGNLVCPSSYDLGEDVRVVLLSATEGEDRPLKYPTTFNTADVAVITKTDLAEAVEFELPRHTGIFKLCDLEWRCSRFRRRPVVVFPSGFALPDRQEGTFVRRGSSSFSVNVSLNRTCAGEQKKRAGTHPALF